MSPCIEQTSLLLEHPGCISLDEASATVLQGHDGCFSIDWSTMFAQFVGSTPNNASVGVSSAGPVSKGDSSRHRPTATCICTGTGAD